MQWDAHDDVNANHEKMCGHVDKPIAALLTDLIAAIGKVAAKTD